VTLPPLTGAADAGPPRRLRGSSRPFPGAVANAGIDLAVYPGEVLAILGENGAGKSTLMSILAGLYRPDAGTIAFDGAARRPAPPGDASSSGSAWCTSTSASSRASPSPRTVLLGLGFRAPFLLTSRRASWRWSGSPETRSSPSIRGRASGSCRSASGSESRSLKMLYRRARLLVLDEPTAVLTPQEIEPLFTAIRRLAREGRSAVFISHKRWTRCWPSPDRIVVLRAGRVVGETRPSGDHAAPPGSADGRARRGGRAPGATGCRLAGVVVDNAARSATAAVSRYNEVTLEVRRHEILGIAGVAGSGQRELLEVIAGLRPPLMGRVSLDGGDITRAGPRRAMAARHRLCSRG